MPNRERKSLDSHRQRAWAVQGPDGVFGVLSFDSPKELRCWLDKGDRIVRVTITVDAGKKGKGAKRGN